jgi:predicted HAD superfamily Cof-like phosphohydrolase
MIEKNISDYTDAYTVHSEKKIKTALASLYLNCLFASTQMDLTNEQWDTMWADVQRANMSKERATSATQSKRKSTYDIIKPEGWVPPRTEELIRQYMSGDQ